MAGVVFPVISGATAAGVAVLTTALAVYIGAGRFRYKVSLGDGGNDDLHRRVRMHGNLIEIAPLFLILMALTEMTGAHDGLVRVIGPLFLLCRLAHAYGLSARYSGPNVVRALGVGVPVIMQLIMAWIRVAQVL